MNIAKATRKYEGWMAGHCAIVPGDLRTKHRLMRRNVFTFFRGAFYRWMQLWPSVCPDVADAPTVTAVGDLHVENFGTWRDVEGRLAWGVNDFDECARLPYTNDLVRLMTGALLAARGGSLRLSERAICRSILEGYGWCLFEGGNPFVFDGHYRPLHRAVTEGRTPPAAFWRKLKALPAASGHAVDRRARKALLAALPDGASDVRFKRRTAGVGSLGRPRIVALATWEGGLVAREAKATVPSAAVWTRDAKHPGKPEATVDHAIRSTDPTLTFRRKWIVRRLSPECARIELTDLPRKRDERQLLRAMGVETANVHLGDRDSTRDIRADLQHRSRKAFERAAGLMVEAMKADWRAYRRR